MLCLYSYYVAPEVLDVIRSIKSLSADWRRWPAWWPQSSHNLVAPRESRSQGTPIAHQGHTRAMAPRRSSSVSAAAAPAADAELNQLPSFNGSQMELNKWLRDLANSQHLFESDVAYFLITGCSVTSAGKTA